MKTLTLIFLFLNSFISFSQKIYYSSNSLLNTGAYNYDIVGSIKNKTIVWQTNASGITSTVFGFGENSPPNLQTSKSKSSFSNIFIYDSTMQLLQTIGTDILKNAYDARPKFFVAKNNFKVLYQDLVKKQLSYKVAVFDGNGNLQSLRTLDSLTYEKDIDELSAYGYAILQSENKNNVCLAKMYYDADKHLLNLNYSFIDDTIVNKQLAFSVDINKESLASINIDNDKNLLLVFTSNEDSTSKIKVIKRSYSDSLMLIAEKNIDATGLKNNPVYIVQNTNGYIVFAELNANNNKNLFVWQTDRKLDDVAGGDTTIAKPFSGLLNFISSNTNTDDIFIMRNDVDKRSPDNVYGTYNSRYALWPVKSYGGPFNEYTSKASGTQALKNIELFGVNKWNTITWSKVFANDSGMVERTDFYNSTIVRCNKNVHIIYQVEVRRGPRSLGHIIIAPDGTTTETNYTAWDMNYHYNLKRSKVTDDNMLVVIATKGNTMRFAKIKIE